MDTLPPPQHTLTTHIAAVDLGSSSFRMVVAAVKAPANAAPLQLYTMDNLREPVQLGAGLQSDGRLSQTAQDQALKALRRFGKRLQGFAPHAVRAVATHAVRVASNATEFIAQAEQALGFAIEVIDAEEEARLIYFGVAKLLPESQKPRLVVDIGGGSSEFIVGQGFEHQALASIAIGSVGMAQRYFADGHVNKQSMQSAIAAARQELAPLQNLIMINSWQQAIGSSGTARTLARICVANGFSKHGISNTGLSCIQQHAIEAGHLHNIALHGLKEKRLSLLLGGLAVMSAVFSELKIDHMQTTQGALRHGLLHQVLQSLSSNEYSSN